MAYQHISRLPPVEKQYISDDRAFLIDYSWVSVTLAHHVAARLIKDNRLPAAPPDTTGMSQEAQKQVARAYATSLLSYRNRQNKYTKLIQVVSDTPFMERGLTKNSIIHIERRAEESSLIGAFPGRVTTRRIVNDRIDGYSTYKMPDRSSNLLYDIRTKSVCKEDDDYLSGLMNDILGYDRSLLLMLPERPKDPVATQGSFSLSTDSYLYISRVSNTKLTNIRVIERFYQYRILYALMGRLEKLRDGTPIDTIEISIEARRERNKPAAPEDKTTISTS